jgi:ketosteroid isomerase-like protein
MKPFTAIMLAGVAICPIGKTDIATAAAPAAASARMSAAECEVWNRERSFAKSVESHDAAAFAEHIHQGAVFNAGTREPVRGRAAVVADWKDIIEGSKIVLRWSPGVVSIGGNPDIALSSGPAWIENPDPQAKQPHTISAFTSTWVKGSDGQWRVLFDGSGAPPRAVSADDVRKLVASLPHECPRA